VKLWFVALGEDIRAFAADIAVCNGTQYMNSSRTAQRTKTLDIEPIDDRLVRFRATLDDRSFSAEGEEVIHSLAIEGEISLPDLVIRSIEPHAYHQPYPECGASLQPVRGLVGIRIGPGFRDTVLKAMGRTLGCTHFLTLALDLGAAHTLSLYLRMRAHVPRKDPNGRDDEWMKTGLSIEPHLENACIALRSESRLIKGAK
jgi:DUF2889 family protein